MSWGLNPCSDLLAWSFGARPRVWGVPQNSEPFGAPSGASASSNLSPKPSGAPGVNGVNPLLMCLRPPFQVVSLLYTGTAVRGTQGWGCGHVGVVRVASDVPNHQDLRMAKGSQDTHSVRSASGGDTEASRKEFHALRPSDEHWCGRPPSPPSRPRPPAKHEFTGPAFVLCT